MVWMKKAYQWHVMMGLSLWLFACQSPPGAVQSPTEAPASGLSSEIEKAEQGNLISAQNHLTQARNAFFNVTGRLINIDTDIAAYQEMVNNVLPAMLTTANSLTVASPEADGMADLQADFEALFKDGAEQMLNGINLSLQVYQNQFEAPQSLEPALSGDANALLVVAKIFEATELAERYMAELAQFSSLVKESFPQQTLNAIRSQQTVAINGVISFANQSSDQDALKQAYQVVVRSLTSPNLFNQLTQLAVKAFGNENVAFQQNQLTPAQTNPNQVVMIIREAEATYREIRFENNLITNQLKQDSRGLSAADLLNQSQVVVVQPGQTESNEGTEESVDTENSELPETPPT